jgi:hypothetical protein
MSSKMSVGPVVRDHFATLSSSKSVSARWRDYSLAVGVPVLVGVAALIFHWQLASIGEIATTVSILAGLLFALVIYVFQLRIDVAHDPRIANDGIVARLLDELFSNVLYAVLVGLASAVVVMIAANTRTQTDNGLDAVNPWWTAAVLAIVTHLIMTIFMCLKRTRSAYHRLSV